MSMGSTGSTFPKKLFNSFRLLGIFLFIFIIFRVNLKAIGQILLATDASLLLLGILFQLLVLLSKGIRWHLMNDGKQSWKQWALSLGRFYESYAIGIVTPGRIGEMLKAGHETGKNNILGAVIRVLAERGMDIGIFVLLAGLSVLSRYYLDLKPAYGWLIISGGIFIILVSVLLLVSRLFTVQLNSLLSLLPGRWKDVSIKTKRFPVAVTSCILMLSVVSNLSYFISCYYLGFAAGMDAEFLWISGGVAVSGLLNLLPVTIMGLGTRELIFMYVFQAFDLSIVLAFSFLVVLAAQIGGGLVSLIVGQYLLYKTRTYIYD